MKTGKSFFLIMTGIVAGGVVLLQPAPALAQWDEHHRERDHLPYSLHHPYPRYGEEVSRLPGEYISFGISGKKYFFSSGIFYRRDDRQYVIVAPPVGTLVAGLPSGYKVVVVNGITYYTHNDVYYQYTPYGYQVVPQPMYPVMMQAPVIVSAATPVTVVTSPPSAPVTVTTTAVQAPSGPEAFTINIPDDKGGYVSVVITRSGKGFTGPQKEYYETFPGVEQLKVMYLGK